MSRRRQHECAYCYALFNTVYEHMSHVTTAHVGEKVRRGWSCWRCAKENRYETTVCECGFHNPYKETTK